MHYTTKAHRQPHAIKKRPPNSTQFPSTSSISGSAPQWFHNSCQTSFKWKPHTCQCVISSPSIHVTYGKTTCMQRPGPKSVLDKTLLMGEELSFLGSSEPIFSCFLHHCFMGSLSLQTIIDIWRPLHSILNLWYTSFQVSCRNETEWNYSWALRLTQLSLLGQGVLWAVPIFWSGTDQNRLECNPKTWNRPWDMMHGQDISPLPQHKFSYVWACPVAAGIIHSKTSEQRTHWGWAICPL